MDDQQTPVIGPLSEPYLDSAVRIHQASLGYTFNSRLGPGHLRFLYEVMCGDERSYVGAALKEARVVGIVSGTLDADRLKKRLLRAMSVPRAVSTAFSLILRPWLVVPLWQGNIVAALLCASGLPPELCKETGVAELVAQAKAKLT